MLHFRGLKPTSTPSSPDWSGQNEGSRAFMPRRLFLEGPEGRNPVLANVISLGPGQMIAGMTMEWIPAH
jgi:hypothetical protein